VKKAYDETSGSSLSVEEYIDLYGQKLDRYGTPRVRPTMICYACKGCVHTVGEIDGMSRDAVWAHDPDRDRACPVKSGGAEKYELLTPVAPDAEAGKRLRETVLANWRKHMGFVETILPVPDIGAWIGFIRYADRTRFWEHVGLQEWHIPYVFLAACDFPPPDNPRAAYRRPYWIRFRFTSVIRTVDDLWIRTTGEWEVLGLKFRASNRANPRPQDYIDAIILRPDPTWVNRYYTEPNPFQIERMRDAFGY
jgi:hypothetical protein